MNLPSKTIERKLLENYDFVVGVDEVGVGCLAGPVVACAAVFSREFFEKNHPKLRRIRDSKMLSAGQREKLAAELLKERDLKFKIALTHPAVIDKINIHQATRQAMKRAVKLLLSHYDRGEITVRKNAKNVGKFVILIDGPHKIPGLDMKQIPIVRGDQKVFTIACASILAKVYRDKLMTNYAKKFPGYGFEKHKGYGTKLHLECLASLGPCSLHRRSFAPVAGLL